VIAAHGNSLRALSNIWITSQTRKLFRSTFPPYSLVYELDKNLKPIKHYYLGNAEEIAKAMPQLPIKAKQRNNAKKQVTLVLIVILAAAVVFFMLTKIKPGILLMSTEAEKSRNRQKPLYPNN